MQTLATGVGDLKKVFTNVKTRGRLAQVLSPDQFGTLAMPVAKHLLVRKYRKSLQKRDRSKPGVPLKSH